MMALYRYLRDQRVATAFAVISLTLAFAAPAQSGPLGLSPGDEVQFLEWDALRTVSGDGGSYNTSNNIFTGEGRINSVELNGGAAIGQSNVEFNFNLDFVSEILTLGLNSIGFETVMQTTGGSLGGPDFTITEGGVDVLFGNFITAVVLTGNIDIPGNSATGLTSDGQLGISGGDAALVAALGGVGTGVLLQTATVFDFNAPLSVLAGEDLQVFNSNFVASLSGLLTPLESAPVVPEPSTALLVGGGLIGVLGFARRARR
jgi:hypothetical protein